MYLLHLFECLFFCLSVLSQGVDEAGVKGIVRPNGTPASLPISFHIFPLAVVVNQIRKCIRVD